MECVRLRDVEFVKQNVQQLARIARRIIHSVADIHKNEISAPIHVQLNFLVGINVLESVVTAQ